MPYLKVVIVPAQARKPYFTVQVYEHGKRVFQGKRIIKPDYVLRWFIYNQSLLDSGFAKINRKKSGSVIVVFGDTAERHFKLFMFHVYSVLNVRSARRADCLARCWSQIDTISPVVDALWELSRITDVKRFSSSLRGYCLCK